MGGVTLSIPSIPQTPDSPSMSIPLLSGIDTIKYSQGVIDPIWFPQMLDLFSCLLGESPASTTPRVGSAEVEGAGGGIVMLHLYLLAICNLLSICTC